MPRPGLKRITTNLNQWTSSPVQSHLPCPPPKPKYNLPGIKHGRVELTVGFEKSFWVKVLRVLESFWIMKDCPKIFYCQILEEDKYRS